MAEAGRLSILAGLRGTWIYKWFPTTLAPQLGLPIDGARYSSEIHIVFAHALQAAGSDHLPVLIRFDPKEKD